MLENYLVDLEERLLRYVRIDTQSDESTGTVPSTTKQFDLLRLLRDELQALGTQDVELKDYGAVFATLPATVDNPNVPTIALFAHVDTSPSFSGHDVKPIVHRGYNGDAITLPNDPSQVLSPDAFPYLRSKTGDDIVTASGDTLLGADDKAGVAIIMTAAAYLLDHPELPRGNIRLASNTDEEIGLGVRSIPMEDIGADYAYTLDGGELGEIEYETFSADKAIVDIRGVSTHPGTAKGILVNALLLAAKLISFLPQQTRTPETTSGREGFIHLYQMKGNAAEAQLSFILRDFELDGLRAHGALLEQCCAALQTTEPRAQVNCTITPQYRNMRYWLEKDMRPVDLAVRALQRAGLVPITRPIRGGTDGSQLTERGLPTPNLFTGMQNLHGPLEWISLQDMAKATETCIHLVRLWTEDAA